MLFVLTAQFILNTFHAQIPSFPMSKKISKESLIQLFDGPASVVNK